MANNVEVTQGSGTVFKTTDNAGVHTGHVNVDSSALPTGAATAAAQATSNTALGAPDDASATGDGSIIGILKRLRALLGGTLTVSGTVTANTGLTQPLTDDELRAAAVDVDTGLSQPLTDTQLRATAVPVSGPVTDTQLRASAVPVVLKTPAAADVSGGTNAADGLADSTVGITARAIAYFFNGTTLDRARGDTTNGLDVDVTRVAGGGVAHDGADSGNPIKVGAKAIAALSGATLVSSADRADAQADLDGALLVRENGALGDVVSGNANNTDGSSTQCIAAAGSGIKTYLTDVILTNMSATDIYVEIKDGSTTKLTIPVPQKSGAVVSLKTPIAGTANTAWNFDPSAAATTVYCSMSGFKSKI